MNSFNNTTEFDKKNCYYASLFAQAIYPQKDWKEKALDPNGPIKELAQEFGMRLNVFEKENHRAAICQNSMLAIVVFCGTNDIKDVIMDGKYLQRPMQGNSAAKCHMGFNDLYFYLSLKMSPYLQRLSSMGKTIIFTGHSAGGAGAKRATYDFKYDSACLYTFGSPRVGNRIFEIYCKRVPHYRVINGNDLVTNLPPEKLPISGVEYTHGCKSRIFLNYDGEILIDDNRTLWGSVMERISGLYSDATDLDIIPDNVEDHFIDNYVKILKQWENE